MIDMSQKVFTLKRNSSYYGVNIGNKSYAIGFSKIAHARRVQYVYDPQKPINMVRRSPIDIVGKDTLLQKITIDVNAQLDIPKLIERDSVIDTIDEETYMHEEYMSEFLLFPFQNNVGIILPYDVDIETHDRIVFKSQVIEPCLDRRLLVNFQL